MTFTSSLGSLRPGIRKATCLDRVRLLAGDQVPAVLVHVPQVKTLARGVLGQVEVETVVRPAAQLQLPDHHQHEGGRGATLNREMHSAKNQKQLLQI